MDEQTVTEPADSGHDHLTPAGLLVIYEVLEWQEALGQEPAEDQGSGGVW